MSASLQDTSKYRPYLTIKQIQKILATLKGNPEPEDSDLIAALEVLVWKANQGLSKPSYTPAQTWAQKLDFEPTTQKRTSLNDRINLYIRWKSIHNHENFIASKVFSAAELALIDEYRFTASLMTTEEEMEYTSSLLTAASTERKTV
jgi:hypothetical protein